MDFDAVNIGSRTNLLAIDFEFVELKLEIFQFDEFIFGDKRASMFVLSHFAKTREVWEFAADQQSSS